MLGAAGLDQQGDVALVADPDALVSRSVGQAALRQNRVRERDVVGRAIDDLRVGVNQTLGRRRDLRYLEHVAQLPYWLVGPLFGLLVQPFAHSPTGGSIGVIAILVV